MAIIQLPECTMPWQYDVIQSTRDNGITIVAGGRGVGKGATIQFVIADQALCQPKPKKILYACQNDDLAKELHRDLSNNPGLAPLIASNPKSPHTQIEFKNGSIVRFWSMEKGQKRGFRAHFLCLDECRDIREDIWKQTLKPMITTWGGHALLTSTFKGKLNWFYPIWEKGTKKNKLGIKSFLVPSHMGVCFQGPEGAAKLEAEREIVGDETFRIEYLCEPLEAAGEGVGVFPELLLLPCIGGNLQNMAHRTVLGWDIGRTNDPSAWVIMNAMGQVIATGIIKTGTNFLEQIATIAALAKKFDSFTLVDTTGTIGDTIIDVAKPSIPRIKEVSFRGPQKEKYIKQLRIALERKEIKVPETCTELLAQLRSFRQRDKGSYIEYGNVFGSGQHDDLVNALALCVEGRRFIGSYAGMTSIKQLA